MPQGQEQRHVYYDSDLEIEAYQLSGIVQKFPNHFHEYYVIGFVEGGNRHLWCKNKEYDLSKGDLILFNPYDNHFCAPINGEILDYRAVNIAPEIMEKAVNEICGKDYKPYFIQNVVYQCDLTTSLSDLYNTIIHHASKLEKEETFFFLLNQVLQEYSTPFDEADISEANPQLKNLCSYMEEHFSENITLDELLSMTNFSKSYFLRSFTKQVGVSPYRYLQAVRINKSKKYLEQGISPIDTAFITGFADQSHFTNFFKEFIGLTPKQYQKIFIKTTESFQPIKEYQNDES